MEVATSVLYLQAAFEELDAADDQMIQRAARLAERLDAVDRVQSLSLWNLDGRAVPPCQRQPDDGQRGG